jgi:hypothetical protein
MKILMVHQNMPSQYRELAPVLAATGEHQICFLTQRTDMRLPGINTITYKPFHTPSHDAFGLSKDWEKAAGVGMGAALAARTLEKTGVQAGYHLWLYRLGRAIVFEGCLA